MSDRDDHDARYSRAVAALRTQRKLLGISQADLASVLGKRQQYVSKYESGERRLDLIEYLDAAAALSLDIKGIIKAENL